MKDRNVTSFPVSIDDVVNHKISTTQGQFSPRRLTHALYALPTGRGEIWTDSCVHVAYLLTVFTRVLMGRMGRKSAFIKNISLQREGKLIPWNVISPCRVARNL